MASAGYGDDYVTATDILRTIRSSGGLVVAVIVKPFSFEGQRRQDEVDYIICLDIEVSFSFCKLQILDLTPKLRTS